MRSWKSVLCSSSSGPRVHIWLQRPTEGSLSLALYSFIPWPPLLYIVLSLAPPCFIFVYPLTSLVLYCFISCSPWLYMVLSLALTCLIFVYPLISLALYWLESIEWSTFEGGRGTEQPGCEGGEGFQDLKISQISKIWRFPRFQEGESN